MPSGLPPVYKYCAGIIHCAEMQQRTLGASYPLMENVRKYQSVWPGRTGFSTPDSALSGAKRDADAALPYGRLLRTFRNGVLPQAV